jgi:hypothetical protein
MGRSRKTTIHTVMSSRSLLITRRRNACLHYRLGKRAYGTGECQCCRVSETICPLLILYQISTWKSTLVFRNFNQRILHSTPPTVFRLHFIHKVVSNWSLSLAGITTTGFASLLWIAQIVCKCNTQAVFNIILIPRNNMTLKSWSFPFRAFLWSNCRFNIPNFDK